MKNALLTISLLIVTIPGYCQELPLKDSIIKNSQLIKKSLTHGEFEYDIIQNESPEPYKKRTYYFAFSNQKMHLKQFNYDGYIVSDGEKEYSILLEKDTKYTNNLVKRVNFSRSKMVNNITGQGLLISGKYVCDALPNFTESREVSNPKWGRCLQVSNQSEFKGDKIRDTYTISENGVVVDQEEEIKRGDETYIVKDNVSKIIKIGNITLPISRSTKKFRKDKGNLSQTRSSEYFLYNYKFSNPSDNLFVVKESPGDHFKNGDGWDYWRVGTNGERIYIDVSGGVATKKRYIGLSFILSFSSLIVILTTMLIKRRLQQQN